MFKVNNKDTRTTPMAPCSSVSIVDFKHVNAGWVWVRSVYLVLYTFIEKMFRRYNQTG